MPIDVMVGYIVADSAARNLSFAALREYISSTTTDDTLQHVAKYYYIMDNYDPILFRQWVNINIEDYYQFPLAYAENAVTAKYAVYSENRKLTALLLASDYIMHVEVLQVESSIDSGSGWARHANVVTAEIIDPIKGMMIPQCETETPPSFQKTELYKRYAIPGSCIRFDYRDEWPKSSGGDLVDPNDNLENWITEGQEYIVFLRMTPITGPASAVPGEYTNYYTVFTTGDGYTTTGCMYPIVGGVVQDINNDFGFGEELSAESWKAALRTKIYDLINP
jgi:hypothetical protein